MANAQKQDIALGITRYEYGEPARKRVAVLQIETRKYYDKGLISDASVYWVGEHSRQRTVSLGGDERGDYDRRLKVSGRDMRATQRAIDKQHAEVFTPDIVAGLVAGAKLHYATAISAGVDGFHNVYTREVNNG